MSRGSTLRIVVVGLALGAGRGCVASDPEVADTDVDDDAASSEDDGPAVVGAGTLAPVAPAQACREYCDAFLARCDGTLVRADPSLCTATCMDWASGTTGQPDDPVGCRLAWLDGPGSCIAAGYDSPTCGDA